MGLYSIAPAMANHPDHRAADHLDGDLTATSRPAVGGPRRMQKIAYNRPQTTFPVATPMPRARQKSTPPDTDNSAEVSLKNNLLVSMPQLTSPNFHQTVSLICQHDANGAIGIIVNRLTDHRMGDIFTQLSLPVSNLERTEQPVFEGGPVHPELGLVIHAEEGGENDWDSSLEIGGGLWLTSSRDILGAIAGGRGPRRAIMSLGYIGWGPGQLEAEIQENSWFHAPPDHGLIFNTQIDQKWRQAAELLGIDYARLSTEVGHA